MGEIVGESRGKVSWVDNNSGSEVGLGGKSGRVEREWPGGGMEVGRN